MDFSEEGARLASLAPISDCLKEPGQEMKMAKDGYYYNGHCIICFGCHGKLKPPYNPADCSTAHEEFCQRDIGNKPLGWNLPVDYLVGMVPSCNLPMQNIHRHGRPKVNKPTK